MSGGIPELFYCYSNTKPRHEGLKTASFSLSVSLSLYFSSFFEGGGGVGGEGLRRHDDGNGSLAHSYFKCLVSGGTTNKQTSSSVSVL